METDWKIGDLIQSRWEIHRILKGGMGVVYIVYDREGQEALAAKSFQDQVFARNPNTEARFVKEATAWINLDQHENIVIAKFLQKIDGKPYLFLEYVSGGDLESWIESKRLAGDISTILRFCIQFCDGMIHTRSKGIQVHRDIKSQNCLVTESGVLKITDFGLVKVLDEESQSNTTSATGAIPNVSLTQAGSSMGTCTHMPPEQFDDAKNVDVRADVYSFGIMMFEMFTGGLPFRARNWGEYERLHRTEKLPDTPSLDPKIRRILETCTAKLPRHRYADFAEARRDLCAAFEHLTGQQTPKPKVGTELDAYSLVNKGFSLRQLGKSNEGCKYYDQALSLCPNLAEAWMNKGSVLGAIGQHNEALRCFDRCLQINPNIQQAWANKGRVLFDLGKNEDAIQCFEKAQKINPKDETAWKSKSVALCRIGRSEEAVACLESCVNINPQNASAWFNLGALWKSKEDNIKAAKCFDQATMLNPRHTEAWLNFGDVLGKQGRFQDALKCFQAAQKLGDPNAAKGIEQCRRLLAPDANRYFQLGSDYQQEGNNAEAIRCYEKGLAIDPSNVIIWCNLGAALLALNRGQEAVVCFDRAIALDPRDASAWNNKGCALLAIGKQSEGLACLQEAKRLRV